ncbi:MAG: cell division protein SepF [Clostridia bacterium]|nr:cell division protein SepF [Clostridia bacterium]
MNFSELLSKFLAKDDYDDEPAEREFKDYSDDRIEYTQPKKSIAPETHRERTSSKNNRLVEINTTARLEVAVMSPVVFNDAKEIAEFLSRKNPVVINLEKADRADTRRIVDFLSGVVYAIDGNIQKISNDIFLVTPYNVSVLGSFKEDLKKGVLPWETEEY